jgi:hypothetical protein
VLVYPFFEPTRLPSKKVPQWSLLLRFFRLSKYEKLSSLPSLGSLNLHRRMLPLCVLLTHLHTCVFGLMLAPCCSQLNHLKHALYASPVALCLCVLTPLAPGGFFLSVLFLHMSLFPKHPCVHVLGTSMFATLNSSFVT